MTTKRKHHYLHWRPRGSSPFTEHEVPAHDPPLSPRDEVIFLLHIAAEVEHALMVQYLYAAYSLKPAAQVPQDKQALVKEWRKTLLGIAREEMGHLITVQNLLRLIGAPITLEREDYPFRGDLYPFHFRLEPLSKESLGKYVLAEMPHMVTLPDEIKQMAQMVAASEEVPVNRVGAIYLRVLHLFSPETGEHHAHLGDEEFAHNIGEKQAHYVNWGDGPSVLMPEVRDRGSALAAIRELSEQGEGLEEHETSPSHYQRFLAMYRQFPEKGEWEPVYPVPVDPHIGRAHSTGDEIRPGVIAHPQSRLWAQLSNLHYRRLLAYLSHFLQSDGPLVDERGEFTPRGHLSKWAFDEMRRVGQIAAKLAGMPRWDGSPEAPERAGAPFEIPYTLDLADGEADRWRGHLDVLDASLTLARRIARNVPSEEGPFLQQLIEQEKADAEIMRAAVKGETLPSQLARFKRVVRILEESVRGFDIGVHHNFWRGCTRDQFVEMSIFGNLLIARAEDGRFDPDNSNLIKALRGEAPFDAREEDEEDRNRYPRMPAHHPPILPRRVAIIRHWIADGCPDDDPPGQIGLRESHPS